ncbi:disease resistance protein RPM1-like [Camellia sinensis]|uniref:disease resistance protein RPM1-like n=1 Tax=Camellia sinensis TaxID=4442 RepID=UPI001035752C|nr:disease resistance protein RPM1-like [Camellia sinensis]
MAETRVFHLLANFAPFLQQEAHLLTRDRNEIEYIRDEFDRMMSFLRVADAIEENDPELKVWVKQVREAAYDIGDVLDLFMLRLGHCHGHGFCGFLHKVSYFIETSIARHQTASEVQRMKSKVNNISKGHQRYHDRYGMLEQGSSSRSTGFNKAWHDCRGDALLLDEAELVGIDEPKSQLIMWLVHEDPRLKVLSLSGMGRLGQTTLVKKVFDDAVVKKHFQNHAWITVSESFNIKELLKGKIQQLFEEVRQPVPQGVEYMNTNSLKGLKGIIKTFLQQKRYLFPIGNCGSRVVLTTRNADLALENIYGKSCPSYLEGLSRAILKRCEGLPLAIVAISGLLSTKDKSNVDEWDKINRSLGAELGGNDKFLRMKKILSLSYLDLPYYLKFCFLYLSVFPEDYLIEQGRLIRLWVAEGFVQMC